jgi:hypothetical protein
MLMIAMKQSVELVSGACRMSSKGLRESGWVRRCDHVIHPALLSLDYLARTTSASPSTCTSMRET